MTDKNVEKGKSFRLAFARMKLANEQGFHIEAAAIAESLIADRLHSVFLASSGAFVDRRGKEERVPKLDSLLQRAQGHLDGSEGFTVQELRAFQRARNKAIHGIARSYPGEPTTPVEEWIEHAKDAGVMGAQLARRVATWYRKTKGLSRKASPTL